MNGNLKTDFLTATSTFVIGMGSVLNVGGNHFSYNKSATPEEADQVALASDWAIIGQEIRYGCVISPLPFTRTTTR
jgi:hypothetical protein